MKIYIAGPMTGYKDFNRPAFKAFALKLSLDGNVVLNPAVLPDGLEQREYMDICCAMIRCADAIFMLKGWESSEGAVAEHALARKIGLEIITEYQGGRPMSNIDKQALEDALDFDLFAGDFGDSDDIELSNKIVTGRGEYTCFICYGAIVKGEIHRSAVHKFDGELMTYRVCNECCKAMVSSVNYDFADDNDDGQDPIDSRYALGEQRRKSTKGAAQ